MWTDCSGSACIARFSCGQLRVSHMCVWLVNCIFYSPTSKLLLFLISFFRFHFIKCQHTLIPQRQGEDGTPESKVSACGAAARSLSAHLPIVHISILDTKRRFDALCDSGVRCISRHPLALSHAPVWPSRMLPLCPWPRPCPFFFFFFFFFY
jgi:hypothetical protein